MTREELKTATTEKLISALEYCGRDSYYASYYDEVVDEITERLKQSEGLKVELKKKDAYNKKLLQSDIDNHNKISELSLKVYVLQKQILKLAK